MDLWLGDGCDEITVPAGDPWVYSISIPAEYKDPITVKSAGFKFDVED